MHGTGISVTIIGNHVQKDTVRQVVQFQIKKERERRNNMFKLPFASDAGTLYDVYVLATTFVSDVIYSLVFTLNKMM